jgi:hypothetical protein
MRPPPKPGFGAVSTVNAAISRAGEAFGGPGVKDGVQVTVVS